MNPLSPQGQKTVAELALKYDVSSQAVMTLLQAIMAGHGTMAQFSHPELGGPGQWTQGGMTMVGDMFNNALKAKVDGLCSELADLLRREPSWTRRGDSPSQMQSQGGEGDYGEASLFVPGTSEASHAWWGFDLGATTATGSQNNIRYAYFPGARRLAVGVDDRVVIYDTEDHEIKGISQQQSGDSSLTFVSQHGLVRVAELRIVSQNKDAAEPTDRQEPENVPQSHSVASPSAGTTTQPDVFFTLERLAELHTKGIISNEEFAAKKTELLGRL